MTYSSETVELCHTQQAVKAKCFHPSGAFVEFKKEEIEQSIPDRFEQIVAKYPGRLAVKARNHALTYDELNRLSNRVMERFNIELPIRSLFEAPTVAEMAEFVVRYQKQRAEHT